MAATEPLCHFIGINACHFSQDENWLIEAELFFHLCETLEKKSKPYFKLEDGMEKKNLARLMIHDIILTEEYSIAGIAYHTHTPEEVILDISTGKNPDPSTTLFRKIIEIHRNVRPELYKKIFEKILRKYIKTLEAS